MTRLLKSLAIVTVVFVVALFFFGCATTNLPYNPKLDAYILPNMQMPSDEVLEHEAQQLMEQESILTSDGHRVVRHFVMDAGMICGSESYRHTMACTRVVTIYHNDDKFLPADTEYHIYIPDMGPELLALNLEHELGHVHSGSYHP